MPEVMFNGSVGRIEARFCGGATPSAPVALILHPHPKQGGTMNNKIVNTLFKTFVNNGFAALKFNYRGVGKSEGVYDNGEGELSDAASALDWLQSILPQSRSFWVAGYSFGGLLAMQLLMRRPELTGFIAVSPPANHYDFNFLAPCPVSGQIIQGDKDAYVNPNSVEQLAVKLRNQRGIAIDYKLVAGADHLYQNTTDEIEKLVSEYLSRRMMMIDSLAS
ncbi:MAG: alpha/beta hydrolase [Proteobacteria bacterium]|nr:alpha/beta hydrolase [Pseudomonadota bacterium]